MKQLLKQWFSFDSILVILAIVFAGFVCMIFLARATRQVLEVEQTNRAQCESEKEKMKAECATKLGDLGKQVGAVTAQKNGLEQTLKSGLEQGHAVYRQLAGATVRLSIGCHGVFILFNDEVALLTAAHCVDGKSAGKKGGKKIGDDFQLSYYYQSGAVRSFGYYDAQERKTFTPEQIQWVPSCDIAWVRDKDWQKSAIKERAILLARETPTEMQVVHSTQWIEYCWKQNNQLACQPGELLSPIFGLSRGYGETKNRFDYALPTYPGDSGSGIANSNGELVGIVSSGIMDKAGQPFSTRACGPRSIRMYLDQYWRRK